LLKVIIEKHESALDYIHERWKINNSEEKLEKEKRGRPRLSRRH
jgi:hypothetical protein